MYEEVIHKVETGRANKIGQLLNPTNKQGN